MKIKTSHIIIIILAIVIILLSTCGDSSQNVNTPAKVYRTDSIYVHTTDTVINTIKVPYKIVEYIDSTKIDSTLNGYGYGGTDSLLTYTIFVESEVRPVDVKLKYELKNFTIYDSVYVYVRDSVYQEGEIKSFMSLGGTILGGKNNFGILPQIFYNHKSGNNFGVGFDPLNGNLHITYSKKLSFRKK